MTQKPNKKYRQTFNVNHKPRANTPIPKMNTRISMSTPQMWENKLRDQTEPVPKFGNLVLVMNHQEANRLRNTPKALGNKKEKQFRFQKHVNHIHVLLPHMLFKDLLLNFREPSSHFLRHTWRIIKTNSTISSRLTVPMWSPKQFSELKLSILYLIQKRLKNIGKQIKLMSNKSTKLPSKPGSLRVIWKKGLKMNRRPKNIRNTAKALKLRLHHASVEMWVVAMILDGQRGSMNSQYLLVTIQSQFMNSLDNIL